MKEEKKKKSTKVLIFTLIGILFIVGMFYLSKIAENKNFKEIEYSSIVKSDNLTLLIIDKEDNKSLEKLKDYANENEISMKYILLENLTDKEKEQLEVTDNSKVLIYKNNKIVSSYIGDLDKTNLDNFFTEQGLKARGLQEITMSEYLELIKKENAVIFIGSAQCGYCTKYKPITEKVAKTYGVNIYYLDLASLTKEDINTLYVSSKFFTENEWGTPTTLLFNNGTVTDFISGYVEEATLVDFLVKNKVIA